MSRSRPVLVVFAVVMSMLVVATGPVTASHGVVVVSQNTTADDFNNAQELTNVTVEGSGASANVTMSASGEHVFESFEDGDIDEYGGDTGSFGTTTTFSVDGTQSLNNTAAGPAVISSTSGLSDYPNQGEVWNLSMRTDTDDGFSSFIFGTQNETNFPGGYLVQLAWGDDNFKLFRLSGGNYNLIDETGSTNTNLNASETYRVQVNWTTSDEITATVVNSNGDQVGDPVSATDSTFTDGGIGFRHGQDVGAEYFWDYVRSSAGAPSTPATYISANHTVEQSEQAWVNVTENTNATVTITAEGWDGSSWNQLAQSTGITTVANHTLTWSASSTTKVRINVTVFNDTNNGAPAFTLADDSVGANASAPDVDNSSATPTGDIQTSTPTFEIDVNDTDFVLSQGDSVNVSFQVDNSFVGSDTLTSNGTASFTLSSPLSGGDHTWHVVANDSYGHSVTSQTFSVSTPSELRILNESDPSQLVDNTTVEIRFFTDELTDTPQVFTRNTTDGTVNMTGLPVDKSFIVVAEADGYYDRRIFVPSLFETQEVYLLPTTASGTETIFAIKDYSGAYPQESTVLLVQRSLNGTYRTVLGDYFGATSQFPAVIETGVRHRLVLLNTETGDSRIIGTYTPLSAATQTVTVSPTGEVDVSGLDVTIEVDPATRRLPARNDTQVTVIVADGQNATVADWSASATVVNGSMSTVVWTFSQTDDGSENVALNLTGQAGAELVVNVTANTTAGQSTTDTATFVLDPTFQNDQSLLAVLGQLVELSPPQGRSDFTTFLAIAITVFVIGGLASQLPVSGETAAFGGVLLLAGFTVIAWVPPSLLFVSGVGFVSFAALRRGL